MVDRSRRSLGQRLIGAAARALSPSSTAPPPAPMATRADASVPPAQPSTMSRIRQRLDSVRNPFTGQGTGDKISAGRPDVYRLPLSHQELRALWRFSGLSRRYVEQIPKDATRRGWIVKAEGKPLDLKMEHQRLALQSEVRWADTWGRLYGGAWLLMVTTDDIPSYVKSPEDWIAEPLDLKRVLTLDSLVTLDWSEVTVHEYDTDPRSPRFRLPLRYRLNLRTPGAMGRSAIRPGAIVHASRMIYFGGAKLPVQDRMDNGGVDDSVLEPIWDQVRNAGTVEHSLAALAAEMRITVLKMRDLADVSVGDEAAYFDLRMQQLAQHKSVLNAVLLGNDEDYVHHTGTVAGMAELSTTTRHQLQAVSGMPEQLWLGNAPGGLSTDGESHRNLWANQIASYQTTEYTPLLQEIYDVIFSARLGPFAGVIPESWELDFHPLDEPTSTGRAALRKTVAETDVLYLSAGVLDPQHVAKGRFGADGWREDLPPIDESGFDGLDIDMGAVLAALQASGVAPTEGTATVTDDGLADRPDTDAMDLDERRALAAQLSTHGIERCQHGGVNRCRICGIERRRGLVLGEDGAPMVDDEGAPKFVVEWRAIGDYQTVTPKPNEGEE